MKHLTIFLFLLMGCTPQQKTNIIDLEVSLEKLTLNGQIIEKSDFERELKAIIDRKMGEGFKQDELLINFKVDPRTRRGEIADIQTAMRRLNVRRVNYSALDKEQTSANNVQSNGGVSA